MLKTPITFCNFFFIWFTSFQRKCNQKQKKDNSIQIVNSPFLVKIKRSKLVIFKLPLSPLVPESNDIVEIQASQSTPVCIPSSVMTICQGNTKIEINSNCPEWMIRELLNKYVR